MRIMMRASVCLFALWVSGAAPAYSQGNLVPDVCLTPASTAEAIRGVMALHEEILAPVETVPPEVAEYLNAEIAKAVEQKNWQRFLAAQEHELYEALQIHRYVESAHEWLDTSLPGSGSDESGSDAAGQSLRMFSLLKALHEYTFLAPSISSYVRIDAKRGQPILAEGDGVRMQSAAFDAQRRLVELLECMAIRHHRQPQ